MAKKKQETLHCGTCSNLIEGRFYNPVCYKVIFKDNVWWATTKKVNSVACGKYVKK